MFSVLVKRVDGRERLVYCEGDIEWEPVAGVAGGGMLVLDGREFRLSDGDRAFVMNGDGQTVQRYGRR